MSAIQPIPASVPLLHLLQECRLPVADIAACEALQFFGCFDDARLIGVVGLEPHGEAALLRSLAVIPAQRARGLGDALVSHAERQAATQGIASLYLLTTTAAGFFAARGYAVVPRSDAPAAIQSTAQFSGLCPASSVFMTKLLLA